MFRDRRLVTAAIAAFLVAPPLAGCLGSAQATAMDHRDTAHDRAQQWDEDAQLALIMGLEGDFAAMAGNWSWDGSGWSGSGSYGSGWGGWGWDDHRSPDRHPGDGDRGRQAEAQQSSSTSYWDRAEEDEDRGDGEAAEIAAENNEGIADAKGSENHGFVYVLETNDEGVPVWFIAGGGGGFVVIDARNGDVLTSRSGSYDSGGSGYDYGW